ncbi:hypothetical protein ACTXT7_003495 [Hymenolepis weldensis]
MHTMGFLMLSDEPERVPLKYKRKQILAHEEIGNWWDSSQSPPKLRPSKIKCFQNDVRPKG